MLSEYATALTAGTVTAATLGATLSPIVSETIAHILNTLATIL